MTAVPVAAALLVAVSTVAALASTDPRVGLLGLAAALIGAGLVADPLPGPAILGVRLTAALLAVALLRAAAPMIEARIVESARHLADPEPEARFDLGWPAEALLGLAGGVAGLAISAGAASFAAVAADGGATPSFLGGSPLSAASLALALAAGIVTVSLPIAVGGAGLRRATGVVLLVEGAMLARVGLAAPPGALEEVVLGLLLVTVAATVALLAGAGRRAVLEGSRQA